MKVDAHRLWTIFNYWINKAYNANDPKEIKQLGVDETSQRKGHKYVTVGVALERRKVIHATAGKDVKTLEKCEIIYFPRKSTQTKLSMQVLIYPRVLFLD